MLRCTQFFILLFYIAKVESEIDETVTQVARLATLVENISEVESMVQA
jgi:hypothetical protein